MLNCMLFELVNKNHTIYLASSLGLATVDVINILVLFEYTELADHVCSSLCAHACV